MDESLADKLRSLGVRLGKTAQVQPPARCTVPIEKVLPLGFEDQTPFGTTFVVENVFSQAHQHGNALLTGPENTLLMQRWAKLPSETNVDIRKFLFLDTETSGLAGGTGTYPFMVGLGFFSEQGFKLVQLFMRSPRDEQAMLFSLNRLIDPFDVIVTFNGKTFDIPILNTRHVLHGFSSPFKTAGHIDLLHLSRRIWRNRLKDRSLGSLEAEILGFARGQEEIPGWMIPQIYFDYLRDGDARPLEGVFYHNAIDIVSLAALFKTINGMLQDPGAENVKNSLDMVALAQLFEGFGLIERAVQSYEYGLSQGLPVDFFVKTLFDYAELCRRRGEWEQAVQLWAKAAGLNRPEACIALSKYYEHRLRNYQQAKIWAEEGLRFLEGSPKERWKNQAMKTDLLHRLERINKFITRGGDHAD